MTLWKRSVDWISKADFTENPVSGNITAVERTDGKYGAECTVTVRLQHGTANERVRTFSAFKKNLNWLIEHFGDDDADWIGRTITLKCYTQGDKEIKELI
jgi:hypothetical protein